MAANIEFLNGIAAVEPDDTEEGCDEQGAWARKSYIVDWNSRWQFVLALRGNSKVSGGRGGTWSRGLPFRYPDPVANNLFATTVGIKPFGAQILNTVPCQYPQAIITVTFRPLNWQGSVQNDPLYLNSLSQDPTENQALLYATQELDFTSQWDQVPGASATFLGSGAAISTPANYRTTVHLMVITWEKLPYMPISQARTYVDSINQATFMGCAPETVMFEGPKTVRQQMDDGTIVQKLTYRFKWRNQSWNKFRQPDGTYDYVIYNGNTLNRTYNKMDFSALIFPGVSPTTPVQS